MKKVAQRPEIKTIGKIHFSPPEVIRMDNGCHLYLIHDDTLPVLKMEFVFDTGRFDEDVRLSSKMTIALLKTGTESYTAAQIDDKFDQHAVTTSIPASMDVSSICFYLLEKHFDHVLPIIAEIITRPIFDEDELALLKLRSIQKLNQDLAKNDTLAYRKATEFIFGESHPYGYNSSTSMFENLVRQDIVDYYKSNYGTNKCHIFLSGKITGAITKKITSSISGHLPACYTSDREILPLPTASGHTHIQTENGYQTAIRIGKKLFKRSHKDYFDINIFNTILGGYFGSRLSNRIREQLGYTYNIFSFVDAMHHDGFLMICAEVGNEYLELTIEEIWKIIDRLRNEPVSTKELELVKNFLKGQLLNTLDGVFKKSDVYKSLILGKMGWDSVASFVDRIEKITPDDLLNLANKYIDKESFHTVTVGKCNM